MSTGDTGNVWRDILVVTTKEVCAPGIWQGKPVMLAAVLYNTKPSHTTENHPAQTILHAVIEKLSKSYK